ncbi:Scavenger receptor cysteine-rich type 1 protein M130 [Larimichthys crocea]|uniref:Scavenger receptor cysteine-rich type 1 protein M130 n=1 Tax=Larimichthys crocea TaxID=215358 RepID=A0A6G0ITN3_LARCR|nr:Scavenger receptor cysteine-rich type 1 protein M130 [Larimichthys crocea]
MQLTLSSLIELLIRLEVLVLVLVLTVGSSATVFYYYKGTRGQPPKQEDNMELDYLGGAEDCPGLQIEESEVFKDSVRLVDGTSLCSGRLELKSKSWSSVCEADFDQQDAEVVCRELGCGPPSVLQGELNGEAEVPTWTKEFQCGGNESALLDCKSSDSVQTSCPSGQAVRLTCSDSVRLVNGSSSCSGRLEVKSDQSDQRWSSVCEADFDQQDAEVVCRELGCGAPSVLRGALYGEIEPQIWSKKCEGHESSLQDCVESGLTRKPCSPGKAVELTCSDSVRLVDGTSLCSGRLELKSKSWSSVCEADFDQHDAEVVCRELGCGPPSVLQGELNGEVEAPMWTKEFQCGGNESALLDCKSSDSVQTSCPSGQAVRLTCSEPDIVRLVGGSTFISSTHTDGVSEATQQGFQVLLGSDFTITCSIQPQYPGGSFQLMFTTSATSQNYTQPAVNHSAHFLFSAASHAHQGEYRCVYHVYVFSHNFSSESRTLAVTVSASLTELLIRLVVLVLVLVLVLIVGSSAAVLYYYKGTRGQPPKQEDNMELDYLGGAEDCPGEEAGARGTD